MKITLEPWYMKAARRGAGDNIAFIPLAMHLHVLLTCGLHFA